MFASACGLFASGASYVRPEQVRPDTVQMGRSRFRRKFIPAASAQSITVRHTDTLLALTTLPESLGLANGQWSILAFARLIPLSNPLHPIRYGGALSPSYVPLIV